MSLSHNIILSALLNKKVFLQYHSTQIQLKGKNARQYLWLHISILHAVNILNTRCLPVVAEWFKHRQHHIWVLVTETLLNFIMLSNHDNANDGTTVWDVWRHRLLHYPRPTWGLFVFVKIKMITFVRSVFTLNIQNGLSLHIKSVKMFYIFSVTHP